MTRIMSTGRVTVLRQRRCRAKWLWDSLRVGVAVEKVAEADAAHLTRTAKRGDLSNRRLGRGNRLHGRSTLVVDCAEGKRWEWSVDAVGGDGSALRSHARSRVGEGAE